MICSSQEVWDLVAGQAPRSCADKQVVAVAYLLLIKRTDDGK